MSKQCCNQLQLKGQPVTIKIVVTGGMVTQTRTERVDVIVVDSGGTETEKGRRRIEV